MRKHSKIAIISVAVFVGLLAVYFGGYQNGKSSNPSIDTEQAELVPSNAPALAQTTRPQSSGTQLSSQSATQDLADVDPASIDWEAMKNRFSIGRELNIDPMLVRWNGEGGFTAEEIAAFNKLHVVPFNPKIAQECGPNQPRQRFDREGSIPDDLIEGCTEHFAYPEHPYASLSLEDLMSMAETDAVAAVFAARHSDVQEERIGLALHAAALSEKSGPILEMATREFGSVETVIDGKDAVSSFDAVQRIIFEKVAEILRDPRANPDEWTHYIDGIAVTPEEKQALLEAIDRRAKQVLESMADIQRDLTGSTHIRELIDA